MPGKDSNYQYIIDTYFPEFNKDIDNIDSMKVYQHPEFIPATKWSIDEVAASILEDCTRNIESHYDKYYVGTPESGDFKIQGVFLSRFLIMEEAERLLDLSLDSYIGNCPHSLSYYETV